MPRSLGRFPFPVAAEHYLTALKGHRAEITWKQLAWDLDTIADDVRSLRESGKIRTANPANMTVDDLAEIIAYWRTRARRGPGRRTGTLDETSQHHLWKALKGLVRWSGSPAADRLPYERPWARIPRDVQKPLDAHVKEREDLAYLRAAAETVPRYHGEVAKFLLWFGPRTGLRPKELRLQDEACVHIERFELEVCHPKGEGKWAAPHEPALIADGPVEPWHDFLDARRRFLDGATHAAMIPFRKADGSLGYWPPQSLSKLAKRIERTASEAAGRPIRFQWRDTRPTFGQLAKDGGADIEDVSRAMRHRSTRTTEAYYARVRPRPAFARIRRALNVALDSTPLIDPENKGEESRLPDLNRRPDDVSGHRRLRREPTTVTRSDQAELRRDVPSKRFAP